MLGEFVPTAWDESFHTVCMTYAHTPGADLALNARWFNKACLLRLSRAPAAVLDPATLSFEG
jgi:hypothetical protein